MSVATAYRDRTEYQRNWHVQKSAEGRDIKDGYVKIKANKRRRNSCAGDLKRFCETYFPNAFPLPWSNDHLRAIDRLEAVILEGGLFALAMPRGSGKTTLSVRAAMWALLYGHRRFVSLVGATERLATGILKQIKMELQFNGPLGSDFRQVCYPIQRLQNNGRKAIGQLLDDEPTQIGWGDDRLTFPTLADKWCDGKNVSGSTVSVSALTGALRGQTHALADGEIIRPELVILDDPQTRESAMSLSQCAAREAIITGDVLGMAGPGQDIAAIMPCTVIRKGDMADLMLDREKNPEWNGQKTKMFYAFPKNMKLWEEYDRIRDEGFRAERGDEEALAFYRKNQAEMDEGAVVAWPERKSKRDLSAVQHAMNLLLRDERAFHAEYQNEPLPEVDSRPDDLTADQIAAKVNNHDRGLVPIATSRLTAFIDVHASVLYYVVAAWEDDFTGSVVDYGTFPDQKRPYFSLRDARNTLAGQFPGGLEGQLYAGLDALTKILLEREWERDDRVTLRIERCLIDANWGSSTEVIYKFCRESAFSALLTPSHGKFVGASSNAMREWPKRPGDRWGCNWVQRNVQGKRQVRSVIFDTNWWKSFTYARLAVPRGDRGSLNLFGSKPDAHRLFADHCVSEFRVRTEGRGRVVDEWKQRPERPDNHWWDCLVGSALAASMGGSILPETKVEAPKAKRVSFADLQRRKRA